MDEIQKTIFESATENGDQVSTKRYVQQAVERRL